MTAPEDVIALVEEGMDARSLHARLRRRDSAAGEAGALGHLHRLLAGTYADLAILEAPQGPFPLGVLPLSPASARDPERLAGALDPTREEPPLLRPELVEALRRGGAPIWDCPTFSLTGLSRDRNGAVERIEARIGSYFDMVGSAGYLEYECLAALSRSPESLTLEDLPARRAALSRHQSSLECLASGGGVDAALAISTLVVYAREGSPWMLLDVRSRRKPEHDEIHHVVPALYFQPVTGTSERGLEIEWSVRHNVFREYLEEIFGMPEVEREQGPIAPDYFLRHPNLLLLREMLDAGRAELRGVALVFDLLNHRPEICTLLLIRDESWYERQRDPAAAGREGLQALAVDDRFPLGESERPGTHPETVVSLPLDHPKWAQVARPWLMAPPGAGALILGCREAARLLGIDEPAWLSPFGLRAPGS